MNVGAKLSTRTKTVLVLTLTGVILVLFVSYWYLPTKSYLAARGQYLQDKERELREVSTLTREMPQLEARLQDALGQKEFLERRFPVSFQTDRVIRGLLSAGANAGVSVDEISLDASPEGGITNPGPPTGPAVESVVFRVVCSSSYEGVKNFVGQLKIATPAMKIEDLSIKKAADSSFKCHLTVRTFVDAGRPAMQQP